MAAQLGSKGVRSEINVTPLIDVVLVLLIIFMVVAPTLEARFALALPVSAQLDDPPPETSQPMLVMVRADGTTELNGEALTLAALTSKLQTTMRSRREKVAFFDAEDAAPFGRTVEVMDACRAAGADHIGIIDPDAAEGELPEVPGE